MGKKVRKASGIEENLDEGKIISSLRRAGVADGLARSTAQKVVRAMGRRVTSDDVYQATFAELKRQAPVLAAKYSLKKAIMRMGPSGHPFEQYIGAVLQAYGYETQVSQIIAGECVQHEVDVVADKGEKRNLVECKYHNQPGTRSDIKVALAAYARYLDIAQTDGRDYQAWVVTNTKVTSDAATYGKCVGMRILAWRHPDRGSLAHIIEAKGLYPVTVLGTVDNEAWQLMSAQGIVLVTQVAGMAAEELQQATQLSARRAAAVQAEARQLAATSKVKPAGAGAGERGGVTPAASNA